jgi:predicted histone-like DNA-binding protein
MKFKLLQRLNPAHPQLPSLWYAEAVQSEKIDTDEVASDISKRSTVSPADTEAVLESLGGIFPEKLSKGEAIHLKGVGTFRSVISSDGVLNPEDFHPSHIKGVHIVYTPDTRIMQGLEHIHFEDSGIRGGEGLSISWLEDLLSGTANERLSKGGTVKLTGTRMKIDGTDPSVGLKLIHIETQAATVIPLNTIPVNKANEIIFTVPATLVAGTYQVRLVTQFSGSKSPLKSPRTFTYEPLLTVV